MFLTALGLVVLVTSSARLFAEDLTNASIIEMTKRRLPDDAIIARINSAQVSFSLTDQERLRLKQARVSDKVIAAMVAASAIKVARVTLDGQPMGVKTLSQARTKGRLGRLFAGGPKSVNAYLEGAFSEVTTGPNPVIEIELPEGESIDVYLLVRLDPKETRRELEVAPGDGPAGTKTVFRAASLIAATSVVVRPGLFKVAMESPLMTGEYMLYVLGSADFEKGVYGKGYDFGVRNWVD